MTHPAAPDPAWAAIVATSEEEDAFNELQARLDRLDEHAPSICPPPPSGGGQRPVPSRAIPRPTPPIALATGRSAATGAGTNNEAASGATDALAA